MSQKQATSKDALIQATATITSAYISKHDYSKDERKKLMKEIYKELSLLSETSPSSPQRVQSAEVDIDASVQSDYIICLEDGKKLKMLKRYLKTNYNMSPDEYRQRWGLPANYPMVAPEYAKRRSQLAKKIGLGKHNKAGGTRQPRVIN
tara:strand:+ start:862 stop:1308 length:447 start_codon:yes stop_codon:yes gene_type:complete